MLNELKLFFDVTREKVKEAETIFSAIIPWNTDRVAAFCILQTGTFWVVEVCQA